MRIELQGRPSDPQIAWTRLGDTDFLNRVAGNGAIRIAVDYWLQRSEAFQQLRSELAALSCARVAFRERQLRGFPESGDQRNRKGAGP